MNTTASKVLPPATTTPVSTTETPASQQIVTVTGQTVSEPTLASTQTDQVAKAEDNSPVASFQSGKINTPIINFQQLDLPDFNNLSSLVLVESNFDLPEAVKPESTIRKYILKQEEGKPEIKAVIADGKLYILPPEKKTEFILVEVSGFKLPANFEAKEINLTPEPAEKLAVNVYTEKNPIPECCGIKHKEPLKASNVTNGIEIKDPNIFDVELAKKIIKYADKNRSFSLEEDSPFSNLANFLTFGPLKIFYRNTLGKGDEKVTLGELKAFKNRLEKGKIPAQEVSKDHSSEEIIKVVDHLIENFETFAKPSDDRNFWFNLNPFEALSPNALLSIKDLDEVEKMMKYKEDTKPQLQEA